MKYRGKYNFLVIILALTATANAVSGCGTPSVSIESTIAVESKEDSIAESSSNVASEDIADSPAAEASAEAPEEIDISLIRKPDTYPSYVMNEENVKLVGRNYMVEDALWCALPGSGVEFTYYGKKLDITFLADAARSYEGSRARAAVYINDERVFDTMLKNKSETVTVYEGEKKEVNVKIVKLSEAAFSTFAIAPITVEEGEYILPAPKKERRIEFIGDSITCGYGVDDENQDHHFSTATEDVTRAWAYKVAQKLDADYSIFSYSGWGVVSGYTDNPAKKSASQLVPEVYDKLAFSYQRFADNVSPQDVEWDFTQFAPDVIVVNLGTNDASYCDTDEKKQEFVEGYTAFLKKIRSNNPDAYILCALGTMGNTMLGSIKTAVEGYTTETGDTSVEVLALTQQSMADGIAADWHPTEKTHEKAAQLISIKIGNAMGW